MRNSIVQLTVIVVVLYLFLTDSGQRPLNAEEKSRVVKAGIVYVVLSVDTEPLHISGKEKRLELDLSNFAPDTFKGIVARVMCADWRSRFTDSFGGHPKLTWFALTSQHVCEAAGCSAIYRELMKFQDVIGLWHDELAWHYHHTDWVNCTRANTTQLEWNQLTTFDGTRYTTDTDIGLCENVLNHLIVDEGFFPVSFRSGWVWENNDFSLWLDGVIPFDLSSSPPFKSPKLEIGECRANESDWSRAPLRWYPYNPDSTDYQAPGNLRRYISRSLVRSFKSRDYLDIEAAVGRGDSILLSIPIHSYSNIRHSLTHTLSELIAFLEERAIEFKFATCREAFSELINGSGYRLADIQIEQRGRDLLIHTDSKIFQRLPYAVVVFYDGSLERVHPERQKQGNWIVRSLSDSCLAIHVAMSSISGEAVVKRFVPRVSSASAGYNPLRAPGKTQVCCRASVL